MKLLLAGIASVAAQFGGGNDALVEAARAGGLALESLPQSFIFQIYAGMVGADPMASDMDKMYANAVSQRSMVQDAPDSMLQQAIAYMTGGGDSMRAIKCTDDECTVPLGLRPLFGYGCWCNLGDDILEGYSQPVDTYDNYCRDLQLCLRCVLHDTPGDTCHPNTHVYKTIFRFDMATFSMTADCEGDNAGDDCGVGLCMCEVKWLDNIMNNGFGGTAVNETAFAHDAGFDPDVLCPRVVDTGPQDLQCCGAYPDRFMYNNNNLDCCDDDGNVFNPSVQECCAGEGVHAAGSCP